MVSFLLYRNLISHFNLSLIPSSQWGIFLNFLFFIILYSPFGFKVENKEVLLKCCGQIHTLIAPLLLWWGSGGGGGGWKRSTNLLPVSFGGGKGGGGGFGISWWALSCTPVLWLLGRIPYLHTQAAWQGENPLGGRRGGKGSKMTDRWMKCNILAPQIKKKVAD